MDEVFINLLAQSVIPIAEGEMWFSKQNEESQLNIMKALAYYILQGGGTGKDVDSVIKASGLRATYTSCQLLLKASESPNATSYLKIYLNKIINLPDKNNKWWLNDLSDKDFVKNVMIKNK